MNFNERISVEFFGEFYPDFWVVRKTNKISANCKIIYSWKYFPHLWTIWCQIGYRIDPLTMTEMSATFSSISLEKFQWKVDELKDFSINFSIVLEMESKGKCFKNIRCWKLSWHENSIKTLRWPIFHYYSTFNFYFFLIRRLFRLPLPLQLAHIDELQNFLFHRRSQNLFTFSIPPKNYISFLIAQNIPSLSCTCCAGVGGRGCFCIEISARILCRKCEIFQHKNF